MFLSFTLLGLGVYNAHDLFLVVDETTTMTLNFDHDNTIVITEPGHMDYVRAYLATQTFFSLGTHHYNPENVHHVDVDQENVIAYITDCNSNTHIHDVPAEVGQLLAAAASFVYTTLPA